MWFDIVILAILAYATIRGAMKGIVWQLAAISALVLCFAFAESFSIGLMPYLALQPPLNRWVAMLICYLLFSFASFAAARRLRNWIEKAKFVEYDRHVGAIFGFLKGVTFCLVLSFFMVTLSTSARGMVLKTYSGRAAAVIMDRLHPVMPAELHDVLEPYIHSLDQPGLALEHRHGHLADDVELHGEDGHAHDDHLAPDRPPTGDASLDELLDGLGEIFDVTLRAKIRQAVENTAPGDRPELLASLQSGVPGLMRMIAEEWRDGKPPQAAEPGFDSERLAREISAVYSDAPHAQEAIRDEIFDHLAGVPDRVVGELLQDWHADLLAIHPDPDPETGITTTLGREFDHDTEEACDLRRHSGRRRHGNHGPGERC